MVNQNIKLPPQNIEAEQAVLGGILLENESIYNVLEILESEDFYKDTHKMIFVSMKKLVDSNEPVDVITLTEQLKKSDELEGIGGASYVAYLSDCVPTAANIDYYAHIIKEKSVLRNIISTSTGLISDAYGIDINLAEFIDRAEKAIFDIATQKRQRAFIPMKEIVKESFKKIEKLYEKKEAITGVASGFSDLDKLTSGFQPSDLIILASRPSMGKTSLGLNFCSYASIKANVAVAVFSLEMSREQLGLRMLCSEAKVDASKLRTGFLEEQDWFKLAKAASGLSEAKMYIDDSPSLSIAEIRSRSRRLKRELDIGMVIIDYMQLITVKQRFDSREREIAHISGSLKGLAKELNIPVIALAQLNRGVESRIDKRPQMSDLRESGSIEQDADVIGFIYRDEYYNKESQDKGIAEIIISKQRNGPTGAVKLAFLNQYTKFENLAE